MECEKIIYPLCRYKYGPTPYYAYGNTPPRDFLQNITTEKEPAILVLGCGDIRSCFYSLWKKFDMKDAVRFDGVHFVLNDISAAVLARNILFLYLCLQMPEEEGAVRKWLSGIWAIWYCHELHQDHYDMLNESLRTLCRYSDAWSSKDNPLCSLMKFTSPATRKEVKGMWKMWLDRDVRVNSVEEMVKAREKQFQIYGLEKDVEASQFAEGSTEIPYENLNAYDLKKLQAQKSEVLSYFASGNVYAETVLKLDLPGTKTFINFTLYERRDGKYSLHFRSLPFSSYYQVSEFTKKNLPIDSGLVEDNHFTSNPFLANSVQQFSLWLQSSHKILCSDKKPNQPNLLFTFDCSPAFTLCDEVENSKKNYPFKKFDLIYTSNLMDHLGPPNLILSVIQVLKDSGLLFTNTFCKHDIPLFEDFLTHLFGFGSKFFPLILGVRCINHEGVKYASPVTVKSCPLSLNGSAESLLIWEKLPSDILPLTLSDQPLTSVLAEALYQSIKVSVNRLLETPRLKLRQPLYKLSIETAIKVIQVFMSNTCANFEPDFWKPLTDLMHKSMKPYLSNFQTHILLHGIHMHLVLSKENCPFCLKTRLSDSFGLFSILLRIPEIHGILGFMAIVHKERTDNAEKLCNIARSDGNIHIFDCVSPSTANNGTLELYFYAPLNLVREGYKVNIVASTMIVCFSGPLDSLLTSFTSLAYNFFQATTGPVNKVQLESFGTITSHVSDGDTSDVELAVSQEILSSNELQHVKISSNILELSCGKHTCQLKYPYPIIDCRMRFRTKKGEDMQKVFIHCSRTFQQFEEEKPLFIISPEKELSFTPSESAIKSLCGQQFTLDERQVMATTNKEAPPLAMVKKSLQFFFQTDGNFFRLIHLNKRVALLVLINQRQFDYETKVPVIDLAFCFLEDSFRDAVLSSWAKITDQVTCSDITILDNKEYDLLKTVFGYFASRTNGTCNEIFNSNSRINVLTTEKIEHNFTRAVVHLLFRDPDCYQLELEKCSFCDKTYHSLKKCSRCKQVQYCDKKCQTDHWSEHKTECKKLLSQLIKP